LAVSSAFRITPSVYRSRSAVSCPTFQFRVRGIISHSTTYHDASVVTRLNPHGWETRASSRDISDAICPLPLFSVDFSCDCDRQEGFPPRYHIVRADGCMFHPFDQGSRPYATSYVHRCRLMYGLNNDANKADSHPRKLLHARTSLLR